MVKLTDPTGDDSKDVRPKLPLLTAVLFAIPTMGVPISLGRLLREYFPGSIAILPVALMLPVLAVMYGVMTIANENSGSIATWSVRIGSIGAWILLLLSPIALAMLIFIPSDTPIVQFIWVLLGVGACFSYRLMAQEFCRRS